MLDQIKETANEFNDFFVHAGYNSAKGIPEPRNNNDINKHISQNSSSMFVCKS